MKNLRRDAHYAAMLLGLALGKESDPGRHETARRIRAPRRRVPQTDMGMAQAGKP
jgi:hypothetical protein